VQVIKRIRNKDPTIYKPDVAFFEGDEEEGAKKGKKKDRGEGRKTFKDVVREQVVAAESGRDVVASSDEEGDDEPRGRCVFSPMFNQAYHLLLRNSARTSALECGVAF
jgi:hypothetical protein